MLAGSQASILLFSDSLSLLPVECADIAYFFTGLAGADHAAHDLVGGLGEGTRWAVVMPQAVHTLQAIA